MRTGSRAGGRNGAAEPRVWTAAVAGEVLAEGDRVAHPAHGVGRVVRIAAEEVAGHRLEMVQVAFDEGGLALRVPRAKVGAIGLRRLAAPALLAEAMAVLRGKPRPGRGMWSRRAQEWQAKVDSGDPRVVAEVVRDLGRNAGAAGEGSFSERRLFETALDRLAGEVAAVEGMSK
jgi:CarD family transcriptional regulator